MPNSPVYAIGHSTRSLDQFADLLQAHGVELLCDIRTIPRSRRNPQFNRENLRRTLPRRGIRYRHLKGLGGLRRASKESVNQAWQNSGFRGYADYMQTEDFRDALEQLIGLSRSARCAVMCAEGNPFRCHRRLLADALIVRGVPVRHITSRKSAREHALTAFARVRKGSVTYPANLKATHVRSRRPSACAGRPPLRADRPRGRREECRGHA